MANKLPDISNINNKINVSLYGGKSFFKGVRDSKYRAEIISCDCKNCSYRDTGTCLKITSISSKGCRYGRKYIYEGYTPKAAICSEWNRVFTSDETYGKLKSVSNNIRFGVVGDSYVINTGFVGVKQNEDGTYSFCTSTGIDTLVFIEKDKMNVNFLNDLLTYKPYAIMGGEIKDYRKDIVNVIINQMQKLAPELHKEFIESFPQFADVVINFVGKEVYMNTLKGDIDIATINGVFHLSADRKTLICKDYSSPFLPFKAKTSAVTINVTNDMTYKVQSNDETCSDTRIVEKW